MNRWVPTAPVESDGAKSVSDRPCHELTVLGARFARTGAVSASDGFALAAFALARS